MNASARALDHIGIEDREVTGNGGEVTKKHDPDRPPEKEIVGQGVDPDLQCLTLSAENDERGLACGTI